MPDFQQKKKNEQDIRLYDLLCVLGAVDVLALDGGLLGCYHLLPLGAKGDDSGDSGEGYGDDEGGLDTLDVRLEDEGDILGREDVANVGSTSADDLNRAEGGVDLRQPLSEGRFEGALSCGDEESSTDGLDENDHG